MNKLTFKKVWDDAFACGRECGLSDVNVETEQMFEVRDIAFEDWFRQHQSEEV